MTDDTRCTCTIRKAPTYEVYVQYPCGIHRRMVEDAIERCAEVAESHNEWDGKAIADLLRQSKEVRK